MNFNIFVISNSLFFCLKDYNKPDIQKYCMNFYASDRDFIVLGGNNYWVFFMFEQKHKFSLLDLFIFGYSI